MLGEGRKSFSKKQCILPILLVHGAKGEFGFYAYYKPHKQWSGGNQRLPRIYS